MTNFLARIKWIDIVESLFGGDDDEVDEEEEADWASISLGSYSFPPETPNKEDGLDLYETEPRRYEWDDSFSIRKMLYIFPIQEEDDDL